MGRSVLLVEDDPAIAGMQRTFLSAAGFEVTVVGDCAGALREVARLRPSVVLLDVGLPDGDGVDVVRALRAAGDWTPVLFVTARDDDVTRVTGLELGADDYVTKPFSPHELVARVRAVLRRSERTEPRDVVDADAVVAVGRVRIDPGARRVHIDDDAAHLTATEFDLLLHLARHPGRVLSREQLLAEVWGYPDGVSTRTVDVHIAQLRAKLGEALIVRTVRGVGYAVEP